MLNGRLVSCYNETETEVDVPPAAIKKYHQEILDCAQRSLSEQRVQQREFTNMTLAFDSSRIKEARTAIRTFQKTFAQEFYQKDKKKDSVYQLSVQLFRLDQEDIL